MQPIFHAQELFTLAFQHLGGRDARPPFDNGGDLFGAHGLGDHGFGLLVFRFA